MFKRYALFFFLFIFIVPTIYSQRTERVVIFYKNGDIDNGTLLFHGHSNIPNSFLPNSSKDTFSLNIELIRTISLITKSSRNKTYFHSKLHTDNSWKLFENIHNNGKYPIYKLLGEKEYYLEIDSTNFLQIPTNRKQRKALFQQLLPDSQIVINSFAFGNRAQAYLKFADFLEFPSLRYPSFYVGLKFSYGFFNTKNISRNSEITVKLQDNATFQTNSYAGTIYFNNRLDKKGKITSIIGLGMSTFNIKENQIETNPELVFSARGIYGRAELGFQYYLSLKKRFPYIKLNGRMDYLFKEESLIVSALNIENNNTVLSFLNLDYFNSVNWTPVLGIGVEIPTIKHHFITAEANFSTFADIERKRNLLIDFSIGINLL